MDEERVHRRLTAFGRAKGFDYHLLRIGFLNILQHAERAHQIAVGDDAHGHVADVAVINTGDLAFGGVNHGKDSLWIKTLLVCTLPTGLDCRNG